MYKTVIITIVTFFASHCYGQIKMLIEPKTFPEKKHKQSIEIEYINTSNKSYVLWLDNWVLSLLNEPLSGVPYAFTKQTNYLFFSSFEKPLDSFNKNHCQHRPYVNIVKILNPNDVFKIEIILNPYKENPYRENLLGEDTKRLFVVNHYISHRKLFKFFRKQNLEIEEYINFYEQEKLALKKYFSMNMNCGSQVSIEKTNNKEVLSRDLFVRLLDQLKELHHFKIFHPSNTTSG